MARASLSNLSTFLTKLKSIFSLIGHTHSQYVQNTTYNNKMSSLDSSVSTLSNGKVSKAGDTMSGNLVINKTTQAECDVNNTQANVGVGIVAGSSGARGLYDTVNRSWIVYSPASATSVNLASSPATTDNSTKIATTSYVKNQVTYKDFVFSPITYTAGAIGTRGYQGNASGYLSGYTPVSVSVFQISDSTRGIPVAFISNTNTVYLNVYRTQSTEYTTGFTATVRVMYIAN